jgi:predicted O-methyltransferase YrrM
MLKSQTRVLKGVLVDSVSLCRQALGLPGGRTRSQVAAIKASFNEAELHPIRIALIAQACHRPESEIEAFAAEFKRLDYQGNTRLDGWDSLGAMGLSDCTTLHTLVRAFSPRVCVETGTAAGISATVILRDLARRGDGRLYSIDVDSPRSSRYGALISAELRERWELRLQQDEPLLPALLDELESIDLFLHDSRHTYRHMRWEYETAWPHLRSGGCLASHDVITTTAFDDFRREQAGQIASSGMVGNLGFIIKQ